MPTLKWENLLINKCPKCGKDFALSNFDKPSKMFTHACGFKIKEETFKRITRSQVVKRVGFDK